MWQTLKVWAVTTIDPNDIGLKDPVKDADAALAGILAAAYSAAGVLCVIVIIIAGYIYAVSDNNNVKTAKQAIIGAVIGLIVVMSAFVITQFVLGRF